MGKKRSTRKLRVNFRQNRQARRRSDDWTRQYRADEDRLADSASSESVRAKGELSRKRTIIVDEDDQPRVDEALWQPGTVTKVHGLICYVNAENGRPWECTVRRVLRTLLIQGRAPVTVGDRVWFSDQTKASDGRPVGVVERVEPRTTSLSRRDRRKREQTIVANADQLLAVVSFAQPKLRPHLVDRYIVAALKGGLDPILCFNKVDLLAADAVTADDDQRQSGLSVRDVIPVFRALGYCCLVTSAVAGTGLDDLRAALKDHMTVIAGQSGVGKSTLINALQPGLNLPTRTVSRESEKGRHTTSLAELLPLDFGGYVVDTPGIRAFDLWSVEPGELEAYFVEFIPYVQKCRFHDCMHRNEEDCAVIAAVERGEISARRYYSYLKMFEEV
ncbi:MAG: ribosome small subunit-dependent GTPase A [Phycisphaerae bacterium]|nr:ribosome small subunit-dependent GTPase A [Phycisphaerae bacterium]